VKQARHGWYRAAGKRLGDVAGSLIGLVVLAPVFIVIGLVVALLLGRPVFFNQVRPGLLGVPFRMIKFRSMTDARDSSGQLLPDVRRLGAFGRFLRVSSLDELPELWNVLLGHMSIVGPRPLLMEYLPLYSREERRRHEVRPGITGWAQVNGRNAIRWEQKFELDIWYVDHLSWQLDLKIIALTVWRVLKREGVNPADETVMPRFTGSGTDGK